MSTKKLLTAAEVLPIWLKGTTCWERYRSVIWESKTHCILKHHAHTGYVGRMSPSVCCPTHYALIDKRLITAQHRHRGFHNYSHDEDSCIVMRWEGGRWNKRRQTEAEAAAERSRPLK